MLIKLQGGTVRYWQDGYECRRATKNFDDFSIDNLSTNPFFEADRTRSRLNGEKVTIGEPPYDSLEMISSLTDFNRGYDNIPEETIPTLLNMTRDCKFFCKRNKYPTVQSTEMKWNEGLIYYKKEDIVGFVVLDIEEETIIEANDIRKKLQLTNLTIYLKQKNSTFLAIDEKFIEDIERRTVAEIMASL